MWVKHVLSLEVKSWCVWLMDQVNLLPLWFAVCLIRASRSCLLCLSDSHSRLFSNYTESSESHGSLFPSLSHFLFFGSCVCVFFFFFYLYYNFFALL